jgi:hypothetical protein
MNRREVLIIVKPETVTKGRRQGFRLYWRWKSKAPAGRPKIDKEIRELIGKMSREKPLWGVLRIQAELRLLGYDLSESTVAKYRVRGRDVTVAYYHNFRPHQSLERNMPFFTRDRSAGEGQGHSNPSSRRVASPLPASRIMSATGLAPW